MSLTILATRESRRRLGYTAAVLCLVVMIGFGVMAKNGWLPNTDPISGKKTGWFGRVLPKNAASSWNPLAAPLPSPTPQLSKEYVYAGSRLLSVVDANANETPPADLAVWRPSNGYWYVINLFNSNTTYYNYGQSGDIPVQGDYDGDGKTDFAVVRPNGSVFDWYIVYSGGGSATFSYGLATDKPVSADFDGDGKTDPAVYRSSNNTFYVMRSSDSTTWYVALGTSGDIPASADYDGDGKADFCVWRESNDTFYSLLSGSSYALQTATFSTGTSCATGANCIVSADYDGDGKANYAIRNGAGWIIMNEALTSTTTTTPSGDLSTDIPVQNDYDGDGKVDIAVWRGSNGHWYIRQSGSSNALREETWGTSGDIPVPSYYRR